MNILLIQLKRIGDLVLTTPAIAALRKEFPEATLSLVVSRATEGLLPAIAGIDKALVLRGEANDALDWMKLAWGKFDCCLDFTRNDRSSFLTFLSKARKRITSDHPNLRSKIRARSYNEFVDSPVRLLHTVDYHLALLQPLGIHHASREIQLTLPDSTIEKAEQILQSSGVGGEFIVLHPGSARADKFWETDRWAEVVNYCQSELHLKCLITGGRSSIEKAQIAEIKSSSHREVIDLAGRTDLLTLAALVRRARLLVTVDSAPMHFAAAWGIPQVVLFGPTNPFHWHPRSASAIVLHGNNGGPVGEFNPRQKPLPMNQISTQAVINAMESLLSAPAAPAL
jgi:predicted lipopolysaccharide heptosyltransferase III